MKLRYDVIRLLLLVAMLAALLSFAPKTYQTLLAEISVEEAQSPEQAILAVYGANLFRANSVYVDGERVRDCQIERISYERCRVTVNQSVFRERGKWYKIQLGYDQWGVIHLLGTPLWIQWEGMDTPTARAS